jgi:hypothetical protein
MGLGIIPELVVVQLATIYFEHNRASWQTTAIGWICGPGKGHLYFVHPAVTDILEYGLATHLVVNLSGDFGV